MERVTEPELMEDALQVRAYAEADFDRSDQAFVDRFLVVLRQSLSASPSVAQALSPSACQSLPPPSEQRQPLRIVDLGCGPGNITFRLAQALPHATVLGLDGSGAMLALAEERRRGQPESWSKLRFERLCLPLSGLASGPRPTGSSKDSLASLGGPFAAVVSNSLLHHLHDPMVLWQAVGQLAAPGATIHIKDLRRPSSAEEADALTERHTAGAPALLRRDFRASLAAAFTAREVQAQLVEASRLWSLAGATGTDWSAFSVNEVDDRYLDIHGRWLG